MIKQVRSPGSSGPVDRAYAYTADDERLLTVSGPFEYEFTLRDLDGKVLREIKSDPATETWSVTLDNIWMDGRLVGFVDDDGSEIHAHTDHLGTPRLHTDANGAEVSRHNYFPFGEEITSAAQNLIPMKFTGHERDASTIGPAAELDYMHARYYSPWWGRFTSVDPIGGNSANPQTWNLYSYVANQPVNFLDSTGGYREDFHHDLTEVLALAAGYDANEAAAIARETQAVDDEKRRSPYWGAAFHKSLQKYHFANDEQLGKLMMEALQSKLPREIGTFLHAGQDRFSHAGFSPCCTLGLPGHISASTAPDLTMNDPSKALAAAEWTYNALVTLNAGKATLPFENIATLVQSYLELGEQWTDARERNLALVRKRIQKALRDATEAVRY